MSNFLQIILWVGGAFMLLYTLWLIIRLRNFSRSQDQTFVDSRLWETMIGDEALTPELKKALVNQSVEQQAQVKSDEAAGDAEAKEEEKEKSSQPDGEVNVKEEPEVIPAEASDKK